MSSASATGGDVSTVLGSKSFECLGDVGAASGGVPGPATDADLGYNTRGIAASRDGTRLFVLDIGLGILRVNLPDNAVDVVAAGLAPVGVAVDPRDPGTLYALDVSTGVVALSRVDVSTGASSLVVADLGLSTDPGRPYGLAVDGRGNAYVSESYSAGRVLMVSGIAGSSPTTTVLATDLASPTGLAVDEAGDSLFVAESGIRDQDNGRLLRIDGPGTSNVLRVLVERLATPTAVALDPSARRLFLSESTGHKVTERGRDSGAWVQDVAGTGNPGNKDGATGKGTGVELVYPLGIAVDAAVDVFVLDADSCIVRKVEAVPVFMETTQTTLQGRQPTAAGTADAAPSQTLTGPGAPAGSATPQAQVGSDTAATAGGLGRPFLIPASGGLQAGFGAQLGGASGGVSGTVTAAAAAQPAAAVLPLGPPTAGMPAAAPLAAVLIAGQAEPAPEHPAFAGGDSGTPPGAPRYAMVAHRSTGLLGPMVVLAGAGVVALFGCALILAGHAEPAGGVDGAGTSRGLSRVY